MSIAGVGPTRFFIFRLCFDTVLFVLSYLFIHQTHRSMAHHTVLVANRGEIASRIIAAAKEAGMSTVAIYSEQDRFSGHLQSPLPAPPAFAVG